MRSSLILAAVLAATTLASTAYAAERVARPLSAQVLKDVAAMSQEILISGTTTTNVAVAPLTTSANGFGLSKLAAKMDMSPFGAMPSIPMPANATDAVARERANQWVAMAFPSFKAKYAAWLRSQGLSIGFYNFSQEVNLQTAAGLKKKVIAFNAVIDSSGKPTYGQPKIVEADPLTLDVRYIPLKPAEGLPPEWVFEGAGTIQWRVLNKKMEDVSGWTVIETNGAFDATGEEVLPEEKLACLMDRTSSPACTGPTDVKTLMGEVGTTTAFVSYGQSPEPVLAPTSEEGEFAPVTGLSIDQRVQQCGKYTNKGSVGYLLESTASWYVAELSTDTLSYQLLNQDSFQMVSPTMTYEKTVSVEHLGADGADSYIISPAEGDDELISRADPRIKNGTIDIAYLAPLQLVTTQPMAFTGDAPVEDLSYAGGHVMQYLIGHKNPGSFQASGTRLGRWGVNMDGAQSYSTSFHIDDLNEVKQAQLGYATFEDYLQIKVNGHSVYVGGPTLGGNMLQFGGTFRYTGGICAKPGNYYLCASTMEASVVVGRNENCPAGYYAPASTSSGGLSLGGGVFRPRRKTCYQMGPDALPYPSCTWAEAQTVNTGFGFSRTTTTIPAGWSCYNGCKTTQVKYGGNGAAAACGPEQRGVSSGNINVDIRPYLRAGQNTIELKTLHYQGGHGAVTLAISNCN